MDYVLKHVALETAKAKEKGTGSGGIRIVLHGLLLAPLATEGQEARQAQRIGYLALGTTAPLAIFIDRLREAGCVDGQNVKIDYRFAEGRHDAKGTLAEELVGLNVDGIMAFGDEAPEAGVGVRLAGHVVVINA